MNKTVKLRSGRSGRIRAAHPWIYRGNLLKPSIHIKPADIVTLVDTQNKFVGRGYYNPRSEIALRLLTFKDEAIDQAFFDERIKDALDKREPLKGKTDSFRAVFSEADMLPGLIIDVYAGTCVIQFQTLGMDLLKGFVLNAVRDVIAPQYIYERSDSPFRKREGAKVREGWIGAAGSTEVRIREGKIEYFVDIARGHKTGFYLDQRKSRMALADIVRGKKVLDLFCYTGGFSVAAAAGGASGVVGIDIKEEWLSMARRNAELNAVADKCEFAKEDSFLALKRICSGGERFDIIIVDPPSFIKSRDSIKSAVKGYREINQLAMKALADGGILATFSCSHHMPNEIFSDMLKGAAGSIGKKLAIVKRCHQDIDHPIIKGIPETEYLKGYFVKLS